MQRKFWREAGGDGCGGIPFEEQRPIAGVQNGGRPMTTERALEQNREDHPNE
jgi:hypothetical protein